MSQVHEINKLAIWRPIGTKSFSIRPYGDGYAYLEKGIIRRSSVLTNPVTRYAKNYKKGKKEFSLGIFSKENDTKKIEKWLDKQAKEIKATEIDGKFKILDVRYGG